MKTEGDPFFGAFGSAADAIRVCVRAQRALRAHAWADGLRPLVGMGAHTGDAASIGTDYLGTGIIVAARVMSAAHGQISLSAPTYVAARSEMDLHSIELGVHGLKGVAEPVTLHQVAHDELLAYSPGGARSGSTARSCTTQPTPARREDADLFARRQ